MKTTELSDHQRRLMAMIQRATVMAVDPQTARLKVRFLNNTSAWLPWVSDRAGGVRQWSAPQVGEDVLLLCPQGDSEQAVCLPSLYSVDFPPPHTDPNEHLTVYEDGAVISYQDVTHRLYAVLPDGATTELVSTGGITMTGDLTVHGNVTHNGDTTHNGLTHSTGHITCDADVSDVKGSLQGNRDTYNGHTHRGDSGGTTGPPNQPQ